MSNAKTVQVGDMVYTVRHIPTIPGSRVAPVELVEQNGKTTWPLAVNDLGGYVAVFGPLMGRTFAPDNDGGVILVR
jgi:hypothetical protein